MVEIKTAVTQAKNYVDNLTHLSGLKAGANRVNLYINILKAKAGTPLEQLPASVRKLVMAFTNKTTGIVDYNALLVRTKGWAIQERANDLLKLNSATKQLIADEVLLLDRGSQVGRLSSKNKLLRPDFQLDMGNGQWATFDLTTTKQAMKIMKYNHRRTPILIEFRY